MATNVLFSTLDKTVFSKLRFKEVSHKKLTISFSAMPGGGKTSIARPLAEQLKAIYIETDDIRKHIIDELGAVHIDEINDALYEYLPHLYEMLNSLPNGLIVLDATINQYPEDFFKRARKYRSATFIIRLEVPVEEIKKRILVRGDKAHANTELYFKRIPKRQQEHDDFKRKYDPDIVLGPDAVVHIDELAAAVRKKLATIK